MRIGFLITGFLVTGIVAGCAEEPPPPSVEEFVANKILRDAAMAKCSSDRARLKYTSECVNAREASNRIAKFEEAERRKVLEAQSERKRAALRRAQMAAAEARRRAEEAARRREEAEYLGLFQPAEEVPVGVAADGGAPRAEAPVDVATEVGAPQVETPLGVAAEDSAPPAKVPAASDSAAPALQKPAVSGAPAGSDLQSIREELERRQQAQQ